jgi:hypothetical protein
MRLRIIALVAFATAVACSNSNDNSGNNNAPPDGPKGTATIGAQGGTVQVQVGAGQTLAADFPASAVPAGTSVTMTSVSADKLPKPVPTPASASLPSDTDALVQALTAVSNTYVAAFYISTSGNVTQFNAPVAVSGTGQLASLSIAAGTVITIAKLSGNAWVDVATAICDASGKWSTLAASNALPGVLGTGYYLVYLPAAGTSTAVANFGIALIADDSNGMQSGLQIVNLLDAHGAILPTPTLTFVAFAGAGDIDGQALTPGGSQGVLVDGGNTVRFFTGTNTGVPIGSTKTVDVSAYGGDGDAIAITPRGDEAIVSADSSSQLVVISGIESGNPVLAEVIAIPSWRDGLVLAPHAGGAMLARGSSGITVFKVAYGAARTGSLGGTLTSTYTQIADLPTSGTGVTVSSPNGEDGRDGMAFDPQSDTRAVVVGMDYATGSQVVQLLTGLDGTPAVTTLKLTNVSFVTSIAMTPDGKYAVVGTDSGLVLVQVGASSLTQVNATPFNPSFTAGTATVQLGWVPTVGITLDGKYVVALTANGTSTTTGIGYGTLLVFPIPSQPTATAPFGDKVAQLDGVAVPDNDQILMH